MSSSAIANNKIIPDTKEKSIVGQEKKNQADKERGKKETSGKAAGFPNLKGSRKIKMDIERTSNPIFMFSVLLCLYIKIYHKIF